MADGDVDTGRLRGLVDETGLSLNELIDLWTRETGSQLATVGSALAAGDVHEAMRVVHGAASATALYGLTDLARELSGIEALLRAGNTDAARPALVQAQAEFTRVSQALARVRQ
jgi:HPt (histidine-containing phosphotransfer) domain-containing protein